MPKGLIPVPDYSGDLLTRSYLTGDWNGTRSQWAQQGIQFGVNYTQIVQSIVEGGIDRTTQYGGGLAYTLDFDLHRMKVLEGALIEIRAESRYGNSVNTHSGSFMPVNTDALFPFTSKLDDDILITITNLNYTQFLSEHLAVTLGKFNTFDSMNEFAGGRGQTQFLNGNAIYSPTVVMTVPYSTLGAGIILIPAKDIIVNSLVINTHDSSTTSGFDDIGEGSSWLTTAQFQYRLKDLPGGQNLSFVYAWDNDFLKIAGGFILPPGGSLTPVTTDESWAVFWDAWQYLWVEDSSNTPIDTANGVQDLQGIGLFARLGFADDETCPATATYSVGLAAKGLIPTRDDDTMGFVYAYIDVTDNRLSDFAALGIGKYSQIYELYYNIQMTPSVFLTLDGQVIDSVFAAIDTAVILGARLYIQF